MIRLTHVGFAGGLRRARLEGRYIWDDLPQASANIVKTTGAAMHASSPAVYPLALGIFRRQDWGLLPILADALEEAGCDDKWVLTHLRSPHRANMRCSVVDAILMAGTPEEGEEG